MNRRAVLYARVSSDDVRAGKEGRNLAEQLRECREFAQAKGYKIVAELQEDDRGASGASMDLPQYKRFLSMAQVGEFDVLIVRELDRLARDLVKQLLTEHELKLAGVGVEYVRGDYAPTPEGKISKNINAAVAEYERDKIRERTMRAKRVMAERGNIVTPGHGPFGYRIVKEGGKTRLEIDPELAKVVRLIFTLCSQGKSIRSIAAELTRLAFPSPADHYPPSAYSRKISKRCEWGRAAIHQILKNKAYIGSWYFGKRSPSAIGSKRHIYNPKDTWIEVKVPPIIDDDLWNAAQRSLAKNRIYSARNVKQEYLLRGRVTCGECFGRMSGESNLNGGRYYLYYTCKNPQVSRKHGYYGYPSPVVDTIAWEWVKQLLSNPDAISKGLAAYRKEQKQNAEPIRMHLATIDGLLKDKRATLERLLDLYLNGEFEKEVLADKKTELEKLIADLEEERAKMQSSLEEQTITPEAEQTLIEFTRKIATGIKAADTNFETRRAVIEALGIEASLYHDEKGEKAIKMKCILGGNNFCVSSPACRGG